MMKDADHDGSGQISFAEFEVALQKTGSKKSVGAMLGTLRAVFNAFDKDKSGTVNTDELRVMCVKLKIELSDAELDRMMKEADPDGSGEIDFGEVKIGRR